MNSIIALLVLVLIQVSLGCAAGFGDDPLPSWNHGGARQSIIDFVERVTSKKSPEFVPEIERVAVFDNDGTLWAEEPTYFQLIFTLDRLQQLASDHPQWETTEPYKTALTGDIASVSAMSNEDLAKIVTVTHGDITADEFARLVRGWLSIARHPWTDLAYTEMTYAPMLELLNYLRANGFKTYIVSGGGVDFMRVFAEQAYGIPPEQVVGTSSASTFEMRDGVPTIVKRPDGLFINDEEGKPVGIYRHIGRRPIFAAGNSDGDLQMLQYTTIARDRNDTTPRFGLIVHHTDAEREWAYDRNSDVGTLDEALDEAARRKWTVVSMKTDWERVLTGRRNETTRDDNRRMHQRVVR